MKAFIEHSKERADALGDALADLDAEVKVALMHYAPVRETLSGEPPEIFPFLGSYLLAEAVDRGGADIAIHGHAHRGREHGVTPGGIHVRNVAQPVIRQGYAVYEFEAARDGSGRRRVTASSSSGLTLAAPVRTLPKAAGCHRWVRDERRRVRAPSCRLRRRSRRRRRRWHPADPR